jgi:broad specificity phosphatase PhoE
MSDVSRGATGQVIAMRHGVVYNPDAVVYARLPGFRLSEVGRDEARRLSTLMARLPVSRVFASPLERAQETAEILAAPHGLAVESDERLNEWDYWSRWAGVPWEEVRETDPDALRAFAEFPADACPEDPLDGVAERLLAWAQESATEDGTVLAVTHESPLAAAYLKAAGRSVNELYSVRIEHLSPVRLMPRPPVLRYLADEPRG